MSVACAWRLPNGSRVQRCRSGVQAFEPLSGSFDAGHVLRYEAFVALHGARKSGCEC